MPKIAWHDFLGARHAAHLPAAHLVVASIASDHAPLRETRNTRGLLDLLAKLIGRLRPTGTYALAVMRDSGTPEIYLAFAQREDAERFAQTVRARPIKRFADWTSARAFELDNATALAIAAALGSNGEIDERPVRRRRSRRSLLFEPAR